MSQDYLKYKPIIDVHISKYRGSDVPDQVLRSKAKLILADTLKTYDPNKGSFESYLNKNLMGLNRFVGSSMQIRMPEYKQQKAKTVMDLIADKYQDDQEIDFKDIGKVFNMSPKSIKSIYAGARRTIVSDPDVETYVPVDVSFQTGSADIEDLYGKLNSQLHKDVFDYAMGTHGKPGYKTNIEIARQLGISESYVRKIKEEILGKVRG